MTREEYLIIKVIYLELLIEVKEIEQFGDIDLQENIDKIIYFFEIEKIINEYEGE